MNNIALSGTLFAIALFFACNNPTSAPTPAHIKKLMQYYITGGTFMMGQDSLVSGCDAAPVHQVTVSSFYMDSSEVTQAEYQSLMKTNPSNHRGQDYYPVEMVTWFDAVLFCNARSKRDALDSVYSYSAVDTMWAHCHGLLDLKINFPKNGYRLPTEAEWEYACRAGTKSRYFWGDTLDGKYCWNQDNSGDSSHVIATTTPNAFRLYDMNGNVMEWCHDWYAVGNYPDSTIVQPDPTGPDSVDFPQRVCRGGAYDPISGWPAGYPMFSATRFGRDPNTTSYTLGIRCVRR